MTEFETICYFGEHLNILKIKMFRLFGPKELSPYLFPYYLHRLIYTENRTYA